MGVENNGVNMVPAARTMIIEIPPEAMRDPGDSNQCMLRIDEAADCDGVICGTAIDRPETGEPASSKGQHSHLVATGNNPVTSQKYTAIAI
jgi:hypothetical protein